MQKDNSRREADVQDRVKDGRDAVSSNFDDENPDQKKVVYPSKSNEDRGKKQDNESDKRDTKKRSEPLEDKSDQKGKESDTITVDENYPGPKESDDEDVEKPGIKGHEDVDHGEE